MYRKYRNEMNRLSMYMPLNALIGGENEGSPEPSKTAASNFDQGARDIYIWGGKASG